MKEILRPHKDRILKLGYALKNIGKATLTVSLLDLILMNIFPQTAEFEDGILGAGAVVGGIIGALSYIAGSKVSNRIEEHNFWLFTKRLTGQP